MRMPPAPSALHAPRVWRRARPCGDCRLRRESARIASSVSAAIAIRHRAEPTSNGDDRAGALPSKSSFQPDFARGFALGRSVPPATPTAPRTRKARHSTPGDRRRYARPSPYQRSSVNPPVQRASVSAAGEPGAAASSGAGRPRESPRPPGYNRAE
jgi:hypothetical protein